MRRKPLGMILLGFVMVSVLAVIGVALVGGAGQYLHQAASRVSPSLGAGAQVPVAVTSRRSSVMAVAAFGPPARGGYVYDLGINPSRPLASGDVRVLATKVVGRIDDVPGEATTVRGRFAPSADPGAVLVRRDPVTGAATHYQVYGPDGLPAKRVDLTGRAHGNVPTPHVVEYQRNVNPETGDVFVRPSRHVRPANPGEIPGG